MLIEPTSIPRYKPSLSSLGKSGTNLYIAYNGRAGRAIVDKLKGYEPHVTSMLPRFYPIG